MWKEEIVRHKPWFFNILFSLFFLFFAVKTTATHLVGGYMTYHLNGVSGSSSSYRVTLYVYRDCSKDGTADEVPFDDDITVCVYKGDGDLYGSYSVPLISQKAVLPVGNPTCKEIANACLRQGVYEGNITLQNNSIGYHLRWERCCRNTQNNLKNDGAGRPYQGQTYYGTIPPSAVRNSSPTFKEVPVPFICANDTTTVVNTAIDDAVGQIYDSLSYAFVTPWQGAATGTPIITNCDFNEQPPNDVNYQNGYSTLKPFGNGGYASIDPYTGLTTYFAPSSGRYAVAIEVTEWRNGKKVSSIRLDLQILVIDCKPNNKPRLSYEGGTQTWFVEAGAQICRDITGIDDKDLTNKITVTADGDIIKGTNGYKGPKAVLTPVTAVGIQKAVMRFCWVPNCTQSKAEPYRVTFNVSDDGCPAKFRNEAVLIYVTPFVAPEVITGPKSVCQFSKNNIYTASNFTGTNKYLWRVVGGNIVGDSTKINVSVNWGGGNSGIVELYVTSQYGCKSPVKTYNVSLLPAPSKPKISGIDTVCLNATSTFTSSTDPSVTYSWTANAGNILGSSANANLNVFWNIAGNQYVTLTVKNSGGCFSQTDTFSVFVSHPKTPPVSWLTSVCPYNNGIEYYIVPPTKGSVYKWKIEGGVQSKGGLSNKIEVDWGAKGIGWVKAIEIDKFGCIGDTVALQVLKDHGLYGQWAKGDTSLCENARGIVYNVRAVRNETYIWFITGGTIVKGQNTDTVIVNWGPAGTGSIGVQSTAWDSVDNLPCSSPVRIRIVNLRPYPKPLKIDGDFEVCQQKINANFQLNGFPASVYVWQVNGLSFAGQGSNNISLSLDTFGSFTMRVMETTQYGCAGPWNDSVLVIHPKPRTSPIVGSDIICYPKLTGYNYSVTGFNNSTYNWWINGGNIVSGIPNNAVVANWNGQQNSEIKTLETSEFGCLGDTIRKPIFIDNPAIECKLVTVDPPPNGDRDIVVYYNLSNAPRYNQKVVIQRRLRGVSTNFGTVGLADPNALFFIDKKGMTDSQSYEYRAVIINLCGDSIYSNQHTDILLRGGKDGLFTYSLNFTDYLGWPGGVQRYELHRLLENKTGWQFYKTYSSPTSDNFSNGKEHYGMWFRIKAIENGGLNRESWSNDIKIYFDPVIFIPNAFTPDGNGLNETFLPNSGGMKTYHLRIFSRWGEKLFETNSTEIGWTGDYLGKPAQEGIYVYIVDYTDYLDKPYSAKGTLHLIR